MPTDTQARLLTQESPDQGVGPEATVKRREVQVDPQGPPHPRDRPLGVITVLGARAEQHPPGGELRHAQVHPLALDVQEPVHDAAAHAVQTVHATAPGKLDRPQRLHLHAELGGGHRGRCGRGGPAAPGAPFPRGGGVSTRTCTRYVCPGPGVRPVRAAARAFAEDNKERAASILAHAALILGVFSLLLSLLIYLFAPFIADHWFKSSPAQHVVLRETLYILAAAVPIAGMTSVFRSVLEAREQFIRIGVIQGALGVTTYIIPVAFSYWFRDARVLVAAAVACRLLAFLSFAFFALRTWNFRIPWKDLDLKSLKDFRRFTFWTVISNVLGTAIVYGDRAFLVRLFGLAELGFYNVPIELLNRVMIVVNAVAAVAFPVLSRHAGNRGLMERVSIGVITLASTIFSALLLGSSLLAPLLLRTFFGVSFEHHSLIVIRTLLFGLSFQSLNVAMLALLNAQGLARPITLMHAVEAPLYFLGLYWFGVHFGLNGVALVWSARAAMEYMVFCFLNVAISKPNSARRQYVGAVLCTANISPIALLALWGKGSIALILAAFGIALSLSWCAVQLVDMQRANPNVV